MVGISTCRAALCFRCFHYVCVGLPADGRLAVGGTLCGRECLAHLCLREAQREPADLEILGKLADLLKVYALLVRASLLRF